MISNLWKQCGLLEKGLLLASLGALVLATALTISTMSFLHGARKAPATVVEIGEVADDRGGPPAYRAVFRFLDASGHAHQVEARIGFGRGRFVVGQRIHVLYKPDAPTSARIAQWDFVWAGPMLSIVFAISFFLFVVLRQRLTTPFRQRGGGDGAQSIQPPAISPAMRMAKVFALGAISSIIMAILFPDGAIVYLPVGGLCLLITVSMWHLSPKLSNQSRREPHDKD